MDESVEQQYALKVTIKTMKERCLQLEKRLNIVEEENMQLKIKYNAEYLELSDDHNKTELEMLREKVAQLTKQKSQLTHNVLMVATENRHLWNRLSKLTQANQSLGNQLIKLTDSINYGNPQSNQTSPSNLIRSRTFTHEAPPKLVPKLDKDVFVDTSLEDISLKILNNIAQEKSELEKQVAQMAEIQNNGSYISNTVGFAYPEDEINENDTEFVQHIEKLKYFKETLLNQKQKLLQNVDLFKKLQETGVFCKSCKEWTEKTKLNTENSKSNVLNRSENDQICPMCTKDFTFQDISEFVKHVESHFVTTDVKYFTDFEMFLKALDLSFQI